MLFQMYEFHKNRLSDEIYRFIDPKTDEPFFKADGSDKDYDEAFTMKIILRHVPQSSNSSNSFSIEFIVLSNFIACPTVPIVPIVPKVPTVSTVPTVPSL
jgi:hypothetical protein